MPRPRKCRRVGFLPNNQGFNPYIKSNDQVVLSIEEIEALRLSDLLEMDQDAAAESMDISRGTFQRIVYSARKKTADALVNGKRIRIEGGHYEVSEGMHGCGRRGRRHGGDW